MQLLERESFLTLLQVRFSAVADGEGPWVFVNGEAGIGSFRSGILFVNEEKIAFKPELFRRTIEVSLLPLKRTVLNRQVLGSLLDSLEVNNNLERIVHRAKAANANELVVRYAPVAAKQVAAIGAHVEASKQYLTAIEYYQRGEISLLLSLYEANLDDFQKAC